MGPHFLMVHWWWWIKCAETENSRLRLSQKSANRWFKPCPVHTKSSAIFQSDSWTPRIELSFWGSAKEILKELWKFNKLYTVLAIVLPSLGWVEFPNSGISWWCNWWNMQRWFNGCNQKYSRLRSLLLVKGLVISFYLGWSGSNLLITTHIIKVGSKS